MTHNIKIKFELVEGWLTVYINDTQQLHTMQIAELIESREKMKHDGGFIELSGEKPDSDVILRNVNLKATRSGDSVSIELMKNVQVDYETVGAVSFKEWMAALDAFLSANTDVVKQALDQDFKLKSEIEAHNKQWAKQKAHEVKKYQESSVKITLDQYSALVLFELLQKYFNNNEFIKTQHKAEVIVLSDLGALLEPQLAVILSDKYWEALERAREFVESEDEESYPTS